jgi:hypothetical protein
MSEAVEEIYFDLDFDYFCKPLQNDSSYDKTSILCHKLGSYCSCGDNLTRNNNTCVSLFPNERTAVVGVVDVE